jgi:ubiquinone/menaquinone biosynthesis C-methylase UbiE
MKQKEIFMQAEGDAWFARNRHGLETRKLPEDDYLLCALLEVCGSGLGLKVLEIGCGDGARLAWLKNHLKADCYGVEPSAQAVAVANSKGINVQQGTADSLPFTEREFDIVLFGFCLYLCDREDLFRIASEADRVLRAPGWIMILDFYSSKPYEKIYHHLPGVKSYKMDCRNLFTWHPNYECMAHKVLHHSQSGFTDDQDEWVAVSTLRKTQKSLIV